MANGERYVKHQATVAEWERADVEKPEPEHLTRDILPMPQVIPLSRMATATGLTEGYCSPVRRGLEIPHQRHRAAPRMSVEERDRAGDEPTL